MSILDGIRTLVGITGPELQTRQEELSGLAEQVYQIQQVRAGATRPWLIPSITEALGVPAILRAVTLISNTTGSLAVEGYRNGDKLLEAPRVVARPNPHETPQETYRDMAYCMATRGETILWIANRDTDGLPSALVVVPPREVLVEENQRNRLFPKYTWGRLTSTRFSPANPEGDFVHITYLKEPGELRGKGPLQLCGAAISVSVEAQEWAANFFASGGNPSVVIKSAVDLSEDDAIAFKAQWAESPPNWPRVIAPNSVEDVEFPPTDTQGAQMLEGRNHQNGDAARMYGIPGSLLEYQQAGSSLTYQNLEGEFTKFVRACLAPNYLEPIEQALSDLLPRSTVTRFNVKGFLRADVKTRWEVYEIAGKVLGLDEAADIARREEGYTPGDVEFAPILPAPPQAIPTRLPQERSLAELVELKCPKCGRIAGEVGGPARITCKRCGEMVVAA